MNSEKVDKIIFGPGTLDLTGWSSDGIFSITKSITIEGATKEDGTPATTLLRGTDWSNANPLISIAAKETANITISNLIVDGNKPDNLAGVASDGIQVTGNTTNVVFNNVTVQNANGAGLSVTGATVSLADFHTNNNSKGGVCLNADETSYPHLTVNTGCSFVESNKIWTESGSWDAASAQNAVTFTSTETSDWTITEMSGTSFHWTKAISTGEELLAAVANAADGATIKLAAGVYVLSKPLEITKAITLQGSRDANNNIVTILKPVEGENNFKADASGHKNLVTVSGSETGKTVNLEFLKIENSYGSGLNVQTAMTTVINGMKIENCAHAGMLVHSQVEASVLETQNNGWGGVNIDKGSTNYDRLLTIKGNGYNFKENAKIWAEKDNCPNPKDLVKFEPGSETDYIYDWQIVQGRGGIPEKDMIYWVTTKNPKSSKFTSRFTSDYSTSDKNGVTYYNTNFYANGNPVTVCNNTDGTTTIGLSDEDQIVLPYGNRVSLYGGAKDATVPASTINMIGGQLRNLYGGGYGSITNTNNQKNGKQADVTGSTNITIAGGTVTNMLVAGGQYYSKSNEVTMKVTGENTSLNWVSWRWI